MSDFLLAGASIRFDYPAANYVCARPRLERRRLRVATIRDTFAQPLEAATLNANPCLARGRYLITGLDLDKGEERSFYLESMQGVQPAHQSDYSVGYCVAVIECEGPCPTGSANLPDEFRVVDVLVSEISLFFARAIAEESNRAAAAAGESGRWAVPLPPGYISQ